MSDDALDKAAEAVRNWIDDYVCSFCERPWRCKVCRTGKTMNKAEDIARAVLEAAGVDRLRNGLSAIAEASTECEVGNEVFDCPLLYRMQQTVKAALQQAGKREEEMRA